MGEKRELLPHGPERMPDDMSGFPGYADSFETIKMRRQAGILELTFHTDGGPLQWGEAAHADWVRAFSEISRDAGNRVVILTGTGEVFSGPDVSASTAPRKSPSEWEPTRRQGMRMLEDFLAIEAPIIAAINGPVYRHLEVPLLADIVLAVDDASIRDSAHFASHVIPGDGVHVVMPLLLGVNRARYFLLTGQTLSAREAHELGLVAELLPRDRLLPRAWELTEQLGERSDLVLRYTRLMLTHALKRDMHELLGYGLALEGLGMAERWADRTDG